MLRRGFRMCSRSVSRAPLQSDARGQPHLVPAGPSLVPDGNAVVCNMRLRFIVGLSLIYFHCSHISSVINSTSSVILGSHRPGPSHQQVRTYSPPPVISQPLVYPERLNRPTHTMPDFARQTVGRS